VVLISHDRRLIEATVEKLFLVADGTVKSFDGDLEDYRKYHLDRRRSPDTRERKSPANEEPRKPAPRRPIKPLKDKADAAEKEISLLMEKIGTLDTALGVADIFTREPDKAAKFLKQRALFAEQLSKAEEKWLVALQAYETALAQS